MNKDDKHLQTFLPSIDIPHGVLGGGKSGSGKNTDEPGVRKKPPFYKRRLPEVPKRLNLRQKRNSHGFTIAKRERKQPTELEHPIWMKKDGQQTEMK